MTTQLSGLREKLVELYEREIRNPGLSVEELEYLKNLILNLGGFGTEGEEIKRLKRRGRG